MLFPTLKKSINTHIIIHYKMSTITIYKKWKIIECPICMDVIDQNSNLVITECGHSFHCSCLMKNTAHNGFGCPNCRTMMAELPNYEDDDDDDDDDSYTSTDSYDYDVEENRIIVQDEILRTFRMFHQQINGEEVEEETIDDINTPSEKYVSNKLFEKGVSYEDLVRYALVIGFNGFNHLNENGEVDNLDENISTIMSDFYREQEEN
jgi:hypothetical protein